MNKIEPLKRCRERATICQKLSYYGFSDKYSGNLVTGCTAGVITGGMTFIQAQLRNSGTWALMTVCQICYRLRIRRQTKGNTQ